MKDDLLYHALEQLSESILLSIPEPCKEGVLKNTKILHDYSQLIHQFKIPEIKENG
ncbi:AtzG-like protein [Commensalibacter papalotli (ex Servin-Garciduenas et al. 2014)]|uniref:AtzG-like protein n=1 Tax=Commensalibacter papalotli (ex Servin-Garciduenas et al. 2014) TaxID=1208583 RepID=UPI0004BAA7E4|nr:AtzG-like protein [Commensalibacter papalotli (ex Servin-Garciduenas et al. 2014)]